MFRGFLRFSRFSHFSLFSHFRRILIFSSPLELYSVMCVRSLSLAVIFFLLGTIFFYCSSIRSVGAALFRFSAIFGGGSHIIAFRNVDLFRGGSSGSQRRV